MSDDSNFLARWSRRKQDVQRSESDASAAQVPAEPLSEDDAAVQAEVDRQVGTAPELSPEELASLPSIEDFTVDTDMTQFLRAGIPAVLRNAALRRMWALDPAIRDYVGEALDYAYDWNVPGGVPGSGPLLASDDVPDMLRQILGNRDAPPPEPEPPTGMETIDREGEGRGAVARGSHEEASQSAALPQEMQEQPERETTAAALPQPPNEAKAGGEQPTALPEKIDEAQSRIPPRRHGGAVPT